MASAKIEDLLRVDLQIISEISSKHLEAIQEAGIFVIGDVSFPVLMAITSFTQDDAIEVFNAVNNFVERSMSK